MINTYLKHNSEGQTFYNKSNELYHWKYIRKYRDRKGNWRYVYPGSRISSNIKEFIDTKITGDALYQHKYEAEKANEALKRQLARSKYQYNAERHISGELPRLAGLNSEETGRLRRNYFVNGSNSDLYDRVWDAIDEVNDRTSKRNERIESQIRENERFINSVRDRYRNSTVSGFLSKFGINIF